MRSAEHRGSVRGCVPRASALPASPETYRHEAAFYAGAEEFTELITAFVRAGLANDEPVLVVVTGDKLGPLRDALGPDARRVALADMADVGRNPARIIPAWRDFLTARGGGGRPVRGVGEPIYAARTADELTECERHESLLNAAFDGWPRFWLLCPYDTVSLRPEVVAHARRTHPYVAAGGVHDHSDGYDAEPDVFAGTLPEPAFPVATQRFDLRSLDAVRALVAEVAGGLPLSPDDVADLLLAVDELATNSVRHGGGAGTVRAWTEGDAVVCEVRDLGRITDPLVGRSLPPAFREGGRGVWIANQLCDLVQIRSGEAGTVVRVRLARR